MGRSQALLGGAQQQNKRPWAHAEIQENPFKLFHCEGHQTLEQVAQRGCGVSVLGESQNMCGHNLGQPTLVDSALSRGFDLDDLQSSLPTSTIQ